MNGFKTILPSELKDNPFTLIGKNWMLVTAEKDGCAAKGSLHVGKDDKLTLVLA